MIGIFCRTQKKIKLKSGTLSIFNLSEFGNHKYCIVADFIGQHIPFLCDVSNILNAPQKWEDSFAKTVI